MSAPPPLVDDLRAAGLTVTPHAPLHKRVWWKVGGPADVLATAHTADQVVAAQGLAAAHGQPLFVLGNGSNLLVSDAGVRGIVLVLGKGLHHSIAHEDGTLTLGAGLKNTVLLARAAKHQWSGLHLLGGIPGTIGGAVRMNAGTHLGELSDLLVSVELALPSGHVQHVPAADLAMAYRTCHLPPGAVVLSATVRPAGLPFADSQHLLTTHLARRKATQPIAERSCGSTFRNPPGDHAGRLIEAAGLKGHTLGGAMVSPKHANFVVNTGHATAADLRSLIEHVAHVVHNQFGVALHREVHFVGFEDDGR